MSVGSSRQYGYSYTQECDSLSGSSHDGPGGLVINVRCPSLSSARWCYKLYSIVFASLGLLLTFIWVCFHLYVLSQTTIVELRLLRYLDIFLGLVEFLSMLSLLYASYSNSRLFIITFMVSSLGVVVLYWGWYAYHSNDSDDMSYVYDDMTGLGLIVTLIFLVLLIPVCLHYRSIELQQGGGSQSVDRERQGDIKTRRNQHRHDRHRNRERSPPPKYHESYPTVPTVPPSSA